MIGPTLGGWLYEQGGPEVPYLVVAAFSLVAAAGLAWLRLPDATGTRETVPLRAVIRIPAVAVCAVAVAVGGGTIAMMEPVLSLYLSSQIGLGPARIGLVFGGGAIITAALHPIFGRIADRTGGRRLTLLGLGAIGAVMPVFALIWNFHSAVVLYAVGTISVAMMLTPSLAYMAEATASAGMRSFGVAYGLYNFAWALGLLAGPALGGFLYERVGFARLTLIWAPSVVAVTLWLSRTGQLPRATGRR